MEAHNLDRDSHDLRLGSCSAVHATPVQRSSQCTPVIARRAYVPYMRRVQVRQGVLWRDFQPHLAACVLGTVLHLPGFLSLTLMRRMRTSASCLMRSWPAQEPDTPSAKHVFSLLPRSISRLKQISGQGTCQKMPWSSSLRP